MSVRVLALLLFGASLLTGCADWKTCEENIDCLIICQCPGREGPITVGPYECSLGTCGASHAADADCVAPCERAPPQVTFGDDDDASPPDDDDSAPDDDDSAADDDDSGA